MRFVIAYLRRIWRSISSLPALIVVLMIGVAVWQASTVDHDVALPYWLARLNVKDIDTIRPLLAAVIGGVFTLTIFSYTMVMDVINRSISNYSPRLVPLLLEKRFHQLILGVSVGTIAHAVILFIVTTKPTPEFPHPPVLAALASALLAILCLVLFIFYIHKISQSIHVNSLLWMSFKNSREILVNFRKQDEVRAVYSDPAAKPDFKNGIYATQSGYLTEINTGRLTSLAGEMNGALELEVAPGTFVHAGELLLKCGDEYVGRLESLNRFGLFKISPEAPLDVYSTGFKHLVEVAVKACSPALNDPGTALTALHHLTELFRIYAAGGEINSVVKDGGVLWLNNWSIRKLRDECFDELKRYLSDDPWTEPACKKALQKVNGYILKMDRDDAGNNIP